MTTQPPSRHGWTTYTRLPAVDHRQPAGPSAATPDNVLTDTDDSLLRELRRLVVDPIVASVLTPDELSDVLVYRLPDQPEIHVRVAATSGEVSQHYLWPDSDPPADLTGMAEQFAFQLEDFVAESRFGWGQQRTARYAIPETFVPPCYRDYLTEPPTD